MRSLGAVFWGDFGVVGGFWGDLRYFEVVGGVISWGGLGEIGRASCRARV